MYFVIFGGPWVINRCYLGEMVITYIKVLYGCVGSRAIQAYRSFFTDTFREWMMLLGLGLDCLRAGWPRYLLWFWWFQRMR